MTSILRLWVWVGRSFWVRLLGLTTPIMAHSLTFAGFGLADAFMVAQISETAVAATGIAGRVMLFNTMLVFGSAAGASIFAAQLFGAGKKEEVWIPLAQAVLFSLLITLPFILIYSLSPQSIIAFASDDTFFVGEASKYIKIVGWTLIGTVFVVPLESTLRALEKTKIILLISAVSVLTNLLLNYILIFGHWGAPEMGLEGAAWATAISRMLQTTWLMMHVTIFDKYLLPKSKNLKALFSPSRWRSFFGIALPQSVQQCAWAGGALTYGFIIAHMGVDVLAIASIIFPLEVVLLSIFIGLHISSATMLGQLLGANKFKLAWIHSKVFLSFSVFCALILCALLWSGILDLKYFFEQLNISDTRLAINATLVMALGLVLKAYNQMAMEGVLRSGGDVQFTMTISLLSLWCIGIPSVTVGALYFRLELHYVMLLILSEELVKAFFTTKRLNKKKWMKNLALH